MEYAVRIKNLSKQYPDFSLNNISLDIPKGSIMGLIGENGSGKSGGSDRPDRIVLYRTWRFMRSRRKNENSGWICIGIGGQISSVFFICIKVRACPRPWRLLTIPE